MGRRPDRFKLGAHFLNLCGLFPQTGSQGLNLAFLQGDGGLLFFSRGLQVLHGAVLFEELVEQHRVHRFVANGIVVTGAVANERECADGRIATADSVTGKTALYRLLPLHFNFCLTTLKNEASGSEASGSIFFALRIVTTDSRSTWIGFRPSNVRYTG